MEKIKLALENCYGIKKLDEEIDFSQSRSASIYAPNGAMKTSFAKTFRDLQQGKDSKDLIFPERPTRREITKEGGAPIGATEVFVIEPYDQDFTSGKMSTLLVNKELKKKYDEILVKIDTEKDSFLKALKGTSGVKVDAIENEISLTFTSDEGEFFTSLGRLEKEVLDSRAPEFEDISYVEVFNEKVMSVLKQQEIRDKIQDYINVYEDLISKSRYFKKGTFNHTNASTIAKSLTDNGFFEADHSVFLHAADGDNNIKTKEELEAVIEKEKQEIINNPGLKDAFEEIDKKLSANAELRKFRDYLATNIKIVPELGGARLNGFRQKLWVSYFKKHKDLYSALLQEYQAGEAGLAGIARQANLEAANWARVINIFNKRFSVPFTLKIENQSGVILKEEVPNIVFEFKDVLGETVVPKADLLYALSTGEKRALYILNIIFEVEARRAENQETLFIVDDVADSFDYKNKYAIIEYLKEISGDSIFRQIILTHNFDFFRTLEGRVVRYQDCYTVEKSSTETKLVKAEYIHNPFKHWMGHLDSNDAQLVASIPFVRNIIEYTKGNNDADYLTLTSLLHIKTDTKTITRADIQRIYNSVFPNLGLVLTDPTKKIYDLLFELVGTCLAATETTRLENKIVLSIAIRLKAEEYMFGKLTNKSEPTSKQTQHLIRRYKTEFIGQIGEEQRITVLDEVDLMTPENIHLNSFMYEPILDMSDESLKQLCRDVSALT